MLFEGVFRHEGVRLPEQLVGRPAEHPLGGRAPHQDASVEILHDDGDGRGVCERPEQLVAFAQRSLRLPTGGDVPKMNDDGIRPIRLPPVAEGFEMAPPAGGRAQTTLHREIGARLSRILRQQRFDFGHIVWMDVSDQRRADQL